jgi:tetratricopeptide (TPR) repeat protein
MFNKYIKIVLALSVFAFSIQQFLDGAVGSTGNGIMLILLSLIFVLLFFKNEFLILAFFQLRKQNLVGASKWLNRIKNPKSALTTKQLGYYNYLKGLIISQENMNQAEKYFRTAISLGLNMDHDLAMAKLNLAGILFTKRRKIEAQKLLKEAKDLDKNGMMTEQIRMMKNQMKKSNIPNQHFGGNNFRRR